MDNSVVAIGGDRIFEVSFEHACRVIRAEAEELGLDLPPIELLPEEAVVCDFTPFREDKWVTDGTTRVDLHARKMIVRNATYLARVLVNSTSVPDGAESYVIHSLRIAFDCDPEKVMRRLRVYRDLN